MKHLEDLFVLLLLIMSVLLGGLYSSADAAVLCANPSGGVTLRPQCHSNETQIDPAPLGLVGPAGPAGPAGSADNILFAGIAADGTTEVGSGTVTSSSGGIYFIDFGRDVSTCVAVATAGIGRPAIPVIDMGFPDANSVAISWRYFDPHPPEPMLPLEYFGIPVPFYILVVC